MKDNTLLYIWLNSIEALSPARKRNLMEYFGDIDSLFGASEADYIKSGLKCETSALEALCRKNLDFAKTEFERAQNMGISLIPYGNRDYPPALYNIYDPPILLYAAGDVSLLQNELAFCIVGSRYSSEYGITAASSIAFKLAGAGFTIVSGLAVGIDSAAHKGALRARGKTIGVAGCGLTVDYPSGNRALRKEILEKGLIISEFPLDTNALAGNFPQRNRILSGLSLGTAVIEAGKRSGALITARYAREQNKDVFALPGNITSPNSSGTNELIADGAQVLLSAENILAEYFVRYPKYFRQDFGSYSEEAYKSAACFYDDEFNDNIIKLLKDGEMHVDDIAKASGEDISKVNAHLTILQIKGLVREKPGRRYELK